MGSSLDATNYITRPSGATTLKRLGNTVLRLTDLMYVLSTMGVSKESISKFLIGNRFHVKLRILSPENCKQSLRES